MDILITLLTSGKNTWKHFFRLVRANNWDKIIIFTSDFIHQYFKPLNPKIKMFSLDFNLNYFETIRIIKDLIHDEIQPDDNIAVNITSGSGKEHTALINALILSGIGFQFVDIEDDNLIILPHDVVVNDF